MFFWNNNGVPFATWMDIKKREHGIIFVHFIIWNRTRHYFAEQTIRHIFYCFPKRHTSTLLKCVTGAPVSLIKYETVMLDGITNQQ